MIGCSAIHLGKVTVEQLNDMLDRNSITAELNGIVLKENIAEGVVIKPMFTQYNHRGNRMIAKYKSEKWAESENVKKPKILTQEEQELMDAARKFSDSVVLPGRVATIVDHITRDGNPEISMKRTREFLKAFIADVQKDHPEVYEDLDRAQASVFNKAVNQQASRLWKEYVFENETALGVADDETI